MDTAGEGLRVPARLLAVLLVLSVLAGLTWEDRALLLLLRYSVGNQQVLMGRNATLAAGDIPAPPQLPLRSSANDADIVLPDVTPPGLAVGFKAPSLTNITFPLPRHALRWVGAFNSTRNRTEVRLSVWNYTVNVDSRAIGECIGNLSVAVVGDSLSRYQYLNLAYFLVHGLWEAVPANLSNENEHTYIGHGDFKYFFEITNQRLNTPVSMSRCVCYRGKIGKNDYHQRMENRYVLLKPHGALLSYFQLASLTPIRLQDDERWLRSPGCARNSHDGAKCLRSICAPGACIIGQQDVTPIRQFSNWTEGLQKVVELVDADVIIFNQGVWALMGLGGDLIASLAQANETARLLNYVAHRLVRASGAPRRLFWKSTTPVYRMTTKEEQNDEAFYARERAMVAMLDKSRWEVLDVFTPVSVLKDTVLHRPEEASDWYPVERTSRAEAGTWDGVHPHPFVHRGLNELLLWQLLGDRCSGAFSFRNRAELFNGANATDFRLY